MPLASNTTGLSDRSYLVCLNCHHVQEISRRPCCVVANFPAMHQIDEKLIGALAIQFQIFECHRSKIFGRNCAQRLETYLSTRSMTCLRERVQDRAERVVLASRRFSIIAGMTDRIDFPSRCNEEKLYGCDSWPSSPIVTTTGRNVFPHDELILQFIIVDCRVKIERVVYLVSDDNMICLRARAHSSRARCILSLKCAELRTDRPLIETVR